MPIPTDRKRALYIIDNRKRLIVKWYGIQAEIDWIIQSLTAARVHLLKTGESEYFVEYMGFQR